MFGSQVLEVMIGLLLIFLALSVVCSGIKEVMASLFSLRAKTLEAALMNMLQDPALVSEILQHPVIAATAPSGEKPSYISSRNFAIALLDIMKSSATSSAAGSAATSTASNAAPIGDYFQRFQAAIDNLPSAKLRKSLSAVVGPAQGNLQEAQVRIEKWFDDTMQRVSGWYKRTAQKIIFAVGIVLCLALNADTFSISKELWNDQALRGAVVAEAASYTADGGSTAQSVSAGLAQTHLQQVKQVADAVRLAQPIPLGWEGGFGGFSAAFLTWQSGLLKVLGILASSFAILMGAPFWFDMLNKLINLRLSGNPPASSQ